MRESTLKLYVSPISQRYMQRILNRVQPDSLRADLRSHAIQLVLLLGKVEECGESLKAEYSYKDELILLLKDGWLPHKGIDTRHTSLWICPKDMDLLDNFIQNIAKMEMVNWVFARKDTVDETGKRRKQIDLLREWLDEYGITENEYQLSSAYKFYQRATNNSKKLVYSAIK